MLEYPETNCEKHPDCLWEWDGYCWICIDCILNRPSVEILYFPDGPKRYSGELYD